MFDTLAKEFDQISMAVKFRCLRSPSTGGDKACKARESVHSLRVLKAVPPVATIRDQTTRHPGDVFSPGQGKRVEEIFGWIKTVGHLRRLVTEINSYQLSLDAFHKTISPSLSPALKYKIMATLLGFSLTTQFFIVACQAKLNLIIKVKEVFKLYA